MLNLQTIAVTPGVYLWLTPAALDTISIREREFSDLKVQRGTHRTAFLMLRSTLRWSCFAMEVNRMQRKVLCSFVVKLDAPAFIHRSTDVVADSQGAYEVEVYGL